MKRRILFLSIGLFLVTVSGCGKKEEPVLNGLSDVKEVVNFSDFTETEIPTEPKTEEPTEPQTESETETETETETEKETETEAVEQPYEEDFDFSDSKVLDAFYSIHSIDGLSRQEGFSDVVSEDGQQRIREVSLHNGDLVIMLYADPYSGATNGKLEVKSSSDYVGAVKEALVALDAGLNEDNIDAFVLGRYNGQEMAPLIGLLDASCSTDNGAVYIVLEKVHYGQGPIPGCSGEAGPSAFALDGSIFHDELTADGPDPFLSLIEGTEGDLYETKERNLSSAAKHFDRDGNLLSEDGIYSGKYEAGDKSYTFDTSAENGNPILTVTYAQSSEISDANLIAKAEHLYQYFYHGSFGEKEALQDGITADHASLKREGNGFILKLG